MRQRPVPKPGILDIELYVGGRSAVPGVAKQLKRAASALTKSYRPLPV